MMTLEVLISQKDLISALGRSRKNSLQSVLLKVMKILNFSSFSVGLLFGFLVDFFSLRAQVSQN